MTQANNQRLVAYLLILILLIAATIGWYLYNSELGKNQTITSDNQSELLKRTNKLAELQSSYDQLEENRNALNKLLKQVKKSNLDKIENLSSTLSEQQIKDKTLQQDIARLSEENDQLSQQQLAKEQTLQHRITRLTEENNQLSEQQLSKELTLQQKITGLAEEKNSLLQQLEKAKTENHDLSEELIQARSEKLAVETRLQQKVESAKLTTVELEAELEKRRTEQASLKDKVESVNSEKSNLLTQLEQEQQSKRNIANLKNRLEQELNETRVEISQLKNQMTVIKLTNEVLFSSGSAQVKPEGKKVLSIIADSLNTFPDRAISVEGHTDNVPIRNTKYSSNWALSVARSLSAVHFFQQKNQITPNRLKVVGFGEYHPISSNETADGRKQNRRIEIKLLPSRKTQ